jgi:peptide/nickel transport system substrate-binding protein
MDTPLFEETEPAEQKSISGSLRELRAFSPLTTLEHLVATLSPFERALAIVALVVMLFSTALMLKALNTEITTEVPVRGGSFIEGMVGSMRFVNPVLAVSDTDRALSSLVYGGLMRSVGGKLVGDIAESYMVSEDGKKYIFTLRPNATFQDGTSVTTDDVVFTIQRALEPGIKSPRRAEWEGVAVEKISDTEVAFVLDKPFASFLQNTTLGILPKHIWQSLSAEEFAFSTANVKAVGSGPYQFSNVTYKSDGIPASYTLTAFNEFPLGSPYVGTITAQFYPNENDVFSAWQSGEIDSVGGLAAEKNSQLPPGTPTVRTTLPRTFGVFFNPEHNPLLADKPVRQALELLISRNAVVRSVLLGFGQALAGPLPTDAAENENELTYAARKKEALALLTKSGWAINPATSVLEKGGKELSLSLSTANTNELKDAARLVAESWRMAGVKVKVELYEPGDLQSTIVRPRAFDALFFGEVVTNTTDLFAFWHSSQKSDPGLNIANFSDKDADRILDKLRSSVDTAEHDTLYLKLKKVLTDARPAAFVYSPSYVYIPARTVARATLQPSMESYERFSDIHTWYIESDRVWQFLIQ